MNEMVRRRREECRKAIQPYADKITEIVDHALALPTPDLKKLGAACKMAETTWAWNAYDAAELLNDWIHHELRRRDKRGHLT